MTVPNILSEQPAEMRGRGRLWLFSIMFSSGCEICVKEKMDKLDVHAEARGFHVRERKRAIQRQREEKRGTGRAGGNIPEGTGSVLCDQDEDDFIRAASFSPCPLSRYLQIQIVVGE